MSGRSQLQRALLDAATVLSSAANIARRAAINIDPGAVASGSGQSNSSNVSKTKSTPWPSQTIALQRKQQHQQDVPKRRADAAPSAPDGNLTEMKVLNAGAARNMKNEEQDNLQENEDLIRQLDDSLKGYFEDFEPEAQSRSTESSQGTGHITLSNSSPKTPPGKNASTAHDSITDNEIREPAKSRTGEESTKIGSSLLHNTEPPLSDAKEEKKEAQLSPPAEPEVQSMSKDEFIGLQDASETPSVSSKESSSESNGPIAQRDTQDSSLTSDDRISNASEPLNDRITEASISDDNYEEQTPSSESTPNLSAEVPPIEEYDATTENSASPLRAAKVPSSRVARLLHYGSLGAGLAWGAAGSYLSGSGSQSKDGKQFMSDGNVRRLVDKLSTMRGAALKLGQFMSIQDSNLLPEQIEQVMLRVQNSANYMPVWQMEKVMREDLGYEWRKSFSSFNDVPFASASIGQVHIATLAEDHPSPLAGKKVAVKIQFPGVRESIGSDLNNLRWLVSASALLPKGLFLDNTIRVMRRELDDECDYEREKEMCKRFGTLLNGKGNFAVPLVVDELCSKRVLTCEMMKGRPLTQAARYSQEKGDNIARSILRLSLEELFTYRLMQTDPNWTNFLYNEQNGKIELIDFGATREYDKPFMDDWLCMLRAAIGGERQECVKWSEKVGYLTGKETGAMQDAHVDSMIALGEPFRPDAPDPYPFAQQTITARVRKQIPLMLRERLTPPPAPTYSLNRKLSGAFLLCARLKANVECRTMLQDVTKDYVLDNQQSSITGNVGSVGLGKRGIHTFHGTIKNKDQEQRRQRRGDLAARWPRHILDAIKEQSNQQGDDEGYISLASIPVSPSMNAVPENSDAKTSELDLKAVSTGAGTEGVDAESPMTAMDLAKSRSEPIARTIRGVSVPSKPSPPGPEDCCMSGCAHCVYDIHYEALMDYHEDLTKSRSKLLSLDPPISDNDWDVSLLGEKPESGTKLEGAAATKKAQDEVDAAIEKLDPSMKAFLQLERSIKKNSNSSSKQA